jgi:hypothetical protein
MTLICYSEVRGVKDTFIGKRYFQTQFFAETWYIPAAVATSLNSPPFFKYLLCNLRHSSSILHKTK